MLNSKKTGDAIDANITTTPSKILYRTELLDHVGKVTKEEQGSEPIKGSLAAPKDGGPVLEIVRTVAPSHRQKPKKAPEVSG